MIDRTTHHLVAPWNVPVPVQAARFEPLDPRDADCAIETDLGAIGAFSVPDRRDPTDLLHADRQVCPEFPATRILGSGRAGWYRGRYLKGVGRTPLCANWTDTEDPGHSSGHLHATAAARELIVSAYLARKGAAHTIVPCTGVLARRLPAGMGEALAAAAARRGRALSPVDAHLQAITVKPGGFARWSNLLAFALASPARPQPLAELARCLAGYACAPDEDPPADGALRPRVIAQALARAAERAAAAFATYFRLGVCWGSYTNNVTLDGRFLDLEVPTLTCEPVLAQLRFHDPDVVRFGLLAGTEVVELAAQVGAAVDRIRDALRGKVRAAQHPSVAEFAAALADALDDAFGPDHWVFDRAALRARVTAVLAQVPAAPVDLDIVARDAVALRFDAGAGPRVPLARAPFDLARAEPTALVTPYVVRGSRLDPAARDERAFVNDLLARVEVETSPDGYLAALADGVAALDRHVRPAAA